MKIGHISNIGKFRETNEDSYYVNDDLGLFIIADGMGGHKAGEVASKIAVDVIPSIILGTLSLEGNETEILKQSIAGANKIIYEKSLTDQEYNGMGTTVVMALFRGDIVFVAHVGDSRAYMINNGEINQITEDHSKVAEMVKSGLLTREEARTHYMRHIITRAVGTNIDVAVDITTATWQEKNMILLCSDGLTDMLEDSEILEIINTSKELQGACDNLVTAANKKAGKDNITVILVG